jgi:hypothetical protein
LAGGIPNLELDNAIVNVEGFEPKVYSDGNHVIFVEFVVSEAQEEGGLAHC